LALTLAGPRVSPEPPVRTVPEPVLLETNRTETRQEEPNELLVPMDLPRAKPRLGHRALRIPVTVPAARRSLTARDVHQLVDEQCFLPSPSGRVGVEVEWLAGCLADPTQPVRHEVVAEAGAQRPAGRLPPLAPRPRRRPAARRRVRQLAALGWRAQWLALPATRGVDRRRRVPHHCRRRQRRARPGAAVDRLRARGARDVHPPGRVPL